LVEPQRTNQYPYSQQFNQWSIIGGITVTENDAISPDGTQNADRVQFTGLGNNYLFRTGTGSAGSNTLSVYAKAKSGTSQKFRFFANDAATISSDQVATNQWQRFTFTYTYSTLNAGIISASTGTSDVLFYGFQHEIGSYPTSYIPTLGASTVTRNADVISKTGISSLIGQTEGTMFCQIKNIADDNVEKHISLSDGTNNNRVDLFYGFYGSGKIYLEIRVGGVVQGGLLNGSLTVTNMNKIAVVYKTNRFELWINGTKVMEDLIGTTFSGTTLSRLQFSDGNGNNIFFGNINSIQLYKTALSSTELAQLTTL
jgi:hypothetical protein